MATDDFYAAPQETLQKMYDEALTDNGSFVIVFTKVVANEWSAETSQPVRVLHRNAEREDILEHLASDRDIRRIDYVLEVQDAFEKARKGNVEMLPADAKILADTILTFRNNEPV